MVDQTVEPTVDIDDDLDKFSEQLFNRKYGKEEKVEEVKEEEVEDSEEVESLETEEETPEEEVEEEAETPEEEEEPEPKPKKKKSAQERFDELTAEKYEERRAREAVERELASLRREMETLKAGREKEEPTPLREGLPENAPKPDAKDKDGNPIYELGEFDPLYIRDLTKFTIDEETKAADARRAQEQWEAGVKAAQEELANAWVDKVAEAEESIPTIRDDITRLTGVFENIEPNYGEYLAMTIMQCDAGPEIMSYFSNNIGEAQKLVAAGPAAATLAIGRLEAQFAKQSSTEQVEQKSNKTVTKAPTPPEERTKGTHGRQGIRGDTPDLDAFSDMFFQKRK